MIQTLRLKKDAERRIFAGHLWIFSNDIDAQHHPLKNYLPGELVQIETSRGKFIAIGYINPQCLLCVRILTYHPQEKITVEFFTRRLKIAAAQREKIFSEKYFRAVFGESDRLPGLVIDQFQDVLVIQLNTAGMESLKPLLLTAAQQVFQPSSIVVKCDSSERKLEHLPAYCEVIGNPLPKTIPITENNCLYHIALLTGQKTGWYFDHRLNRARLATFCRNQRVLDVFSYCGAFSIPCAKNGATEVIAIDRSQTALEQLQQNAHLNTLNTIRAICSDACIALQELQQQRELFDVIILDPPAFIKRKKDIAAGEAMYQKFNEIALTLLKPNSVFFSASCSMHLSAERLLNIIRRAALKTKTNISIIEQCHQGPDHPIHPAMPETNYLKGFLVMKT